MAIDLMNMYVQKSHRLSEYNVAPSVTDVHAGQLFHLNDDGEWEYADGTRKAYPTLNNRYAGKGLGPQGERLEGLDDVSRSGKIACLIGGFEIGVSNDVYDDSETFLPGKALKAATGGKIKLWETGVDDAAFIVGYVTQAPVDNDDFLRYQG